MAMASEAHQLHFLLIPLMSQSHIIPLTDFAVFLARQGTIVSVITTPLNATKYQSIIDHATKSGLKINFIPVKFPGKEAGLPEGCENMHTLPSPDLSWRFFDACSFMQDPIETLAREMKPKPSCIVSTSALSWTQTLAHKLNIPRYIFHTVSCFTLMCSEILDRTKVDETVSSDSETFYLPGLPHKIGFTKSQLPAATIKKSSGDLKSTLVSIKEVEKLARGALINSFKELDPTYESGAWCIGPVCMTNRVDDQTAIDEKHYCLKWLDSMEPDSVIYACFGSLCHLTATQLKEIGSGLERSGRPFMWIIREVNYSPEIDKWLKDEGYEEKVNGIGLVIRGWAPQVQILAHPAIGAFLTHCGWNSTLEGICAGVPMITWPMFAEQFYNEKYVVEVQRVGVAVGVKEAAALVRDEQIAAAIGRVMVGEDSDGMRARARRLSEMAKKAVEEGGSSWVNVRLLIQDVLQLQQQNCETLL